MLYRADKRISVLTAESGSVELSDAFGEVFSIVGLAQRNRIRVVTFRDEFRFSPFTFLIGRGTIGFVLSYMNRKSSV